MSKPKEGAQGPRYEATDRGGDLHAVFPSKERVVVRSTRRRSYPGLKGPAPDTRVLYERLSQMFPAAGSLLDMGCGSGEGLARLGGHFSSVTAVDSDPDAVQFAQALIPDVEVGLQQAGQSETSEFYDLVTIVDVLGQVDSPADFVRQARRRVKQSGRVFIAEPRAYPSQTLVPPVGRAFSRRAVAELLPRAGFEIDHWVDSAGSFVACVAKPTTDVLWEQLAVADSAHRSQQFSVALDAYRRVVDQGQGLLKTEGAIGCAVVLVDLHQYDRACELLLQAAEWQPLDPRPLAGLAEICLISNEPVEALHLAVRSVELDECYLPGARVLAKAAGEMKHEDSLTTWRLANSLAPGDLQTAIELARASSEQGELPYAIWVMERVRDFCGELGCDFHVTLAWLLMGAGRVGEAQVEAEIARVQRPDSASVADLWEHLQTQRTAC